MKSSAKIKWLRGKTEPFVDGKYSRVLQWSFDGGTKISVSSSPAIVPLPMSDASLMDPEEAFLASIASCHMLFFLSIAARRKYIVEVYEDLPFALMGENQSGKKAIVVIELNPNVTFSDSAVPSTELVAAMHEEAHANCFLANSIHVPIKMNIQ